MKPPFPALVSEWHNAPYAAIDPTSPALSHANQTIILTGAGSGIGQAASRAYAAAGATRLILLGRRQARLAETKAQVEAQAPGCAVETFAVDATRATAVMGVADAVGGWDVLVMCAGRSGPPASIADADPDEWWDVVESNVRGYFATLHAFLPSRKAAARIVGVVSAIVNLSPVFPTCHGASAYIAAKLAQIRLLEHVAGECPDAFVVAVHPGIVDTDMSREGEFTKGREAETPFDDVNLPAHFFVWATSAQAAFLRGKFCYANWDVEQLQARAREIRETDILTPNILGWPYEAKP